LAKKRELTDEEQNIVDGIGQALLSQAESEVSAEAGAIDEHRRALAEQNQEQEEFGQQKYLAELEAQQVKENSINTIETYQKIHDRMDVSLARERSRLFREAQDTHEEGSRAADFAQERGQEIDQIEQEIEQAQTVLDDVTQKTAAVMKIQKDLERPFAKNFITQQNSSRCETTKRCQHSSRNTSERT